VQIVIKIINQAPPAEKPEATATRKAEVIQIPVDKWNDLAAEVRPRAA